MLLLSHRSFAFIDVTSTSVIAKLRLTMASHQTISVCTTCSKTATEASLKQCGKCHITQYCSKECQQANWKTHKKACKPSKSTDRPYASVSRFLPYDNDTHWTQTDPATDASSCP